MLSLLRFCPMREMQHTLLWKNRTVKRSIREHMIEKLSLSFRLYDIIQKHINLF
jgi:hypothetical protein